MIRVLILLSVMISLTSCETSYYRTSPVPEYLLVPCEIPELAGNTYGDVIKLAYRQKVSLIECNTRLDAVASIVKEL